MARNSQRNLFWRKWGIALALAGALACLPLPSAAQYNVVAEQGYKRARTMASNERWDDALTALQDVLKKAPNYPDALYLAGVCHLNKGDFVNAEKRLKRLTELNKEFIGGWGMLANVYLATKQYGKIKEIVAALGKVKGGKAESYYFAGLLAYMQKDLDQAERDWRNATRAQPDMAKAHYNLGGLMYVKGDKVRAMQGLKDALRYDPENPLYRYSLADLQIEVGSKAEGMQNLDRVRQQTFRKDIAHLAVARQMWANGHAEKTEKLAAQAIGDNKDLGEAYVLRGRALLKMGRTKDAAESYKKALAGDPNCKEAADALKRLEKPAPADQSAPAPASQSAPASASQSVPASAGQATPQPATASAPQIGTTPTSMPAGFEGPMLPAAIQTAPASQSSPASQSAPASAGQATPQPATASAPQGGTTPTSMPTGFEGPVLPPTGATPTSGNSIQH